MVTIIFDPYFKKKFSKIDSNLKQKIIKQISKLKENPDLGKPMRYSRKGTRELYIKPYRLSYLFIKTKLYLLDIYHKNQQ